MVSRGKMRSDEACRGVVRPGETRQTRRDGENMGEAGQDAARRGMADGEWLERCDGAGQTTWG